MGRSLNESRLTGFHGMHDEEIVNRARQGSKLAAEYLLSKYRSLVEGKARSYYLVGADHEDMVQEGMIGLYKAIRDYRSDRLAHFRAFAELCVTRQIITAVKTATRQKHVPLNCYVSFHRTTADDGGEGILLDILPDDCVVDPEQSALNSRIRDYLRNGSQADLSVLESQVLEYYMQGLSYQEMASLLSRRTKSVDNALQRVKRKIGERMEQGA